MTTPRPGASSTNKPDAELFLEAYPTSAKDSQTRSTPQPVETDTIEESPLPKSNSSERQRGSKIAKELRIRPLHILRTLWRTASSVSKCVNFMWPLAPTALGITYSHGELHLIVFILSYLAMVPCANFIGFASQESTRRLPRVVGHLVETVLTSTPEMVLLIVLLREGQYTVIQAAILGSILATLLLCLGICFFFGGLVHSEQKFEGAVSELGSDLLLTAGMGLMIAGAYHATHQQEEAVQGHVLVISRVTAILLLVSFGVYIYFQMRSHHALYEVLLEAEEIKLDRKPIVHEDERLSLMECVLSLTIGLAFVSLLAINLVDEIPYIVEERGLSESFLGLILVPIVEKAAEHIPTVEDACNNQMTAVLFNVLGAAIQTAMFNTPLVVLVGWAINRPLDLEFKVFNMLSLILSILIVGSFTKDQRSNYLEGWLCLTVYLIIAVGSYFD